MNATTEYRSNPVRIITTFGVITFLTCLITAGPSLAQTPSPQVTGGPEHGFHHSFGNAERWAKEFDDPARDAWQKPEEILDALHLTQTDRVADIGAGTGYFSARIAKRVPDGKVFAVDIEPDMLNYLSERKHREQLHVLQPVRANTDSPNLPEPVDVVLLVDTYHHIDDRVPYFSRLKSSLRPGGRLGSLPSENQSTPAAGQLATVIAESVDPFLHRSGS